MAEKAMGTISFDVMLAAYPAVCRTGLARHIPVSSRPHKQAAYIPLKGADKGSTCSAAV